MASPKPNKPARRLVRAPEPVRKVVSPPAKPARKAVSAPARLARKAVSLLAGAARQAATVTTKRGKQPAKPPGPANRRGPRVVAPDVARDAFATLKAHHHDAHCELDHRSPFELIVATVLSAQSTDVMVNKVTPDLFRRWPTAEKLAAAKPAEVEKTIGRLGFFRQKTKSIVGLSQKLVAEHGGQVPRSLDELVKLPGVGRKTANVVLGVAFGAPEGVVVDTHVQRLSQRLGWTKHDEPPGIEQDLMRTFPRDDWDPLAHVLIFHGRRICTARKPACSACPVSDRCPSAFNAENVGRKPARLRFVERPAKTT